MLHNHSINNIILKSTVSLFIYVLTIYQQPYKILEQTQTNKSKQILKNTTRKWKETWENQRAKESVRELAMEMSLTSLGSSQTFPWPHLRTLAASRFWSFSETMSYLLLCFLLATERLELCGRDAFIYHLRLRFIPRVSKLGLLSDGPWNTFYLSFSFGEAHQEKLKIKIKIKSPCIIY